MAFGDDIMNLDDAGWKALVRRENARRKALKAPVTAPTRCTGCGMHAGGGHYDGCWPIGKLYALPKLSTPKPGTAAHAKPHAQIVTRIADQTDGQWRRTNRDYIPEERRGTAAARRQA